jgi:hypothetical protein
MDILKKVFPLSFKYVGEVANLVIGIIIYVLVGIVGGAVIGLTASLPVVGIILGIVGALLDLYVTAGIVIEILVHCKVLK